MKFKELLSLILFSTAVVLVIGFIGRAVTEKEEESG